MTKHLNMRAIHRVLLRHRIKVMIGIVIWMLSFIAAIMYYRMSRRTILVMQPFADLKAAHQHHEDRTKPSAIGYHCNHPHLIEAKAEVLPQSLMQDYGLSLKSVLIVIRHGDRGPLRPIRDLSKIPFNPLSLKEERRNRLVKESNIIDLFHLLNNSQKYKAVHANSLSFDLVPESDAKLGQLSVMGSLQHLKLGLAMGSVYGKQLNPDSRLESFSQSSISTTTTSFERTFQSAVSFLFGFMNHTKTNPNQVLKVITETIVGCQGSFLCTPPTYCQDCPKVTSLTKVWETVRDETVSDHPALVQLLKKLSKLLSPESDDQEVFIGASKDAFRNGIEKPNQAMDGLNAYVCHDAELPCEGDECVTMDDVERLIVFMNKVLMKTTTDESFQLLSLLKVRGFFERVINHFDEVSSGKNFNKLNLQSAHDITLIPIAVSLGFWDFVVPPYASRISFEVYSKLDTSAKTHSYFFRIIYNGKDVTRISSICKMTQSCVSLEPVTPLEASDLERLSSKTHPHQQHSMTFTLIPVQMLRSFITRRFIELANTDNFEEACSAV